MVSQLCTRAVIAGANSNWLNPENGGQGRISIYLGKPIRAIARFIYALACLTIVSAIGVFYHTGQAIKHTVKSGQSEKAWSHLKAAGQNAWRFTKVSFFILIASLEFSAARCLPTTQRAMSIFLLSMSFLHFAVVLLFPSKFSRNPDQYRLHSQFCTRGFSRSLRWRGSEVLR